MSIPLVSIPSLIPQQEEAHGLPLEQLPAVARVEELGHEAAHAVVLPFAGQVLGEVDENLEEEGEKTGIARMTSGSQYSPADRNVGSTYAKSIILRR